jgi:hypothetical protein
VRAVALACGVALLCVLLLGPIGAVGKKKKTKTGKWWGNFVTVGPGQEIRPGLFWDVDFTLQASKGKFSWLLTDAVARFNCWDGDANDGTITPTSDYFQFDIPPFAGRLLLSKKPLFVFAPPDQIPYPDRPFQASGQSESGRGYQAIIAPSEIHYPAGDGKFKRRWQVTWRINYQCDDGPYIGGERNVFTYPTRQ